MSCLCLHPNEKYYYFLLLERKTPFVSVVLYSKTIYIIISLIKLTNHQFFLSFLKQLQTIFILENFLFFFFFRRKKLSKSNIFHRNNTNYCNICINLWFFQLFPLKKCVFSICRKSFKFVMGNFYYEKTKWLFENGGKLQVIVNDSQIYALFVLFHCLFWNN